MTTYSIIAFTSPDHYVRHRDGVGRLTPITSDVDRAEASFHLVAGLADERLLSCAAILGAGYLHHQDGAIAVQPGPRTATPGRQCFAETATFVLRPGLADVGWISFESYHRAGHYLRHRDGELYVEATYDATFDEDATFRLVPGLHT